MSEINRPTETPVKVIYVTHLVVEDVRQAFTHHWTSGMGPDAIFRQHSLGWDVYWRNTVGALRFPERPDLNPGDRVKISYEKVS